MAENTREPETDNAGVGNHLSHYAVSLCKNKGERIMNKTLPILTTLFTASAFVQAAPQTLNVYTYDSFSADWSAGPKVKAAFEQQFPQCKLNYMAFDNNGTLFNRVRLEVKIKADVVLGLDSYQIEGCTKLNIFEPNKVDLSQLRFTH